MHVSLHLITPIVLRDHDPIYEGDLLPSLINILSITEQSRLIQRECPVLQGREVDNYSDENHKEKKSIV
jgi:hypothetical protein